MPNIAALLKSEIERLSRKQSKSEIEPLKKALAAQRTEIRTLRTRLTAAESLLKALAKTHLKAATAELRRAGASQAAEAEEGEGTKHRFSATGLRSNRLRLGLSLKDYGLLVDASEQSVYNWEHGTVPREKYLASIAELRNVGKREVAKRLAELQG